MISLAHEAGALHKALAPFRKHRINMTKIESRPNKRKAWEYFFFVDCDGHYSDAKLAKALIELQEHCNFVKVLGSWHPGSILLTPTLTLLPRPVGSGRSSVVRSPGSAASTSGMAFTIRPHDERRINRTAWCMQLKTPSRLVSTIWRA